MCVVSVYDFVETFTKLFSAQYQDVEFEDSDRYDPEVYIDYLFEQQYKSGMGDGITHFETARYYDETVMSECAIYFFQNDLVWQEYIGNGYDLFALSIVLGIIPVQDNGKPYDHYLLID